MKVNKHIDDFIRKEKEELVNPYLATRVLAKLEKNNETVVFETVAPIWKKLAVVVSFALVIAVGFGLGSMVKGDKEYISININDAQLENLNLYTMIDYDE
ncbi:MAG: hypothetical protein WBH71_04180 [Bacteroidales bacterium]|jgi:hypothetical protein|nr:hypothetical protein [Bacteroidales bacterium]MDI9593101.1 hypothetical protein [Bacteroidota bacterium]NLH34042.1 hypothetical protein [Lentimicrobium sp.]OQC36697.1 MAG: hypothetical protein BWX63_01697 [Bacteroidetes bacterium ADurb.Bin041]MBP7873696.1 hypothetical protein [Bacteroidales bacterium]